MLSPRFVPVSMTDVIGSVVSMVLTTLFQCSSLWNGWGFQYMLFSRGKSGKTRDRTSRETFLIRRTAPRGSGARFDEPLGIYGLRHSPCAPSQQLGHTIITVCRLSQGSDQQSERPLSFLRSSPLGPREARSDISVVSRATRDHALDPKAAFISNLADRADFLAGPVTRKRGSRNRRSTSAHFP